MLNISSLFHYSMLALYPPLEMLNMNQTPLPVALFLPLKCPLQSVPTGELYSKYTQNTPAEIMSWLDQGQYNFQRSGLQLLFTSLVSHYMYVTTFWLNVHISFVRIFSLDLSLTKALEERPYLFFVRKSSELIFQSR